MDYLTHDPAQDLLRLRFYQYCIPKLSNDKPFNTLKAQVLKCISEALKPKKLGYNDYRITFTVARHQTSSLSLKKESEYEHLLECVLKMKAPAVKILIEASRKPGTTTVRITTCIYALCVWVLQPNKKGKPNDSHGEDNEDMFFEGDADTFEFTVNGGIVYRYEVIGIQ
jgi:hypothetical protein